MVPVMFAAAVASAPAAPPFALPDLGVDVGGGRGGGGGGGTRALPRPEPAELLVAFGWTPGAEVLDPVVLALDRHAATRITSRCPPPIHTPDYIAPCPHTYANHMTLSTPSYTHTRIHTSRHIAPPPRTHITSHCPPPHTHHTTRITSRGPTLTPYSSRWAGAAEWSRRRTRARRACSGERSRACAPAPRRPHGVGRCVCMYVCVRVFVCVCVCVCVCIARGYF